MNLDDSGDKKKPGRFPKARLVSGNSTEQPDVLEVVRQPAVWKGLRLFGAVSHILWLFFMAPVLVIGILALWGWVRSGFSNMVLLLFAVVALTMGGGVLWQSLRGLFLIRRNVEPPPDPISQQQPVRAADFRPPAGPRPGVKVGRLFMFFLSGSLLLGVALPTLHLFILPDLQRFTSGDQWFGLMIFILFGVLGILLLGYSLTQFVRISRYGRLPLVVEPALPLLGEAFRVEVFLRQPLADYRGLTARLTCAKLRIISRNGSQRSIFRTSLWSTTAPLAAERRDAGIFLTAFFSLPADQPASTQVPDRLTDRIVWLIEVADSRGALPLRGEYEIAVGEGTVSDAP